MNWRVTSDAIEPKLFLAYTIDLNKDGAVGFNRGDFTNDIPVKMYIGRNESVSQSCCMEIIMPNLPSVRKKASRTIFVAQRYILHLRPHLEGFCTVLLSHRQSNKSGSAAFH